MGKPAENQLNRGRHVASLQGIQTPNYPNSGQRELKLLKSQPRWTGPKPQLLEPTRVLFGRHLSEGRWQQSLGHLLSAPVLTHGIPGADPQGCSGLGPQ